MSVNCYDRPNRFYVARNLREMNLDCLIVTFACACQVITAMYTRSIIRLFLHKAAHVIVVSLTIELKNGAVNITTCIPTQSNI